MPYEMTRTQTGDSGERQPAISPLPTISSLPELTEMQPARATPVRTKPTRPPLAPQRAPSSYRPTPAPTVPSRAAHVPLPPPNRWIVARRTLGRSLNCNFAALRRCMNSVECWVCCIVFIYLGLQAAHGIWLYYYIDVSLNPNPQRFINSTFSRWQAYGAFLWLFGAIYSFINLYLFGALGVAALFCQICTEYKLVSILCGIVIPPICVFFIVVPMFGSLIFTTPLQRITYNHRCDSWAAQVVLDGRSYQDPLYVPNTALFVTAGDSRPLFSFDLDQPEDDWARFHLRKFESPEEAIELQYIPAVREIVYDFVNLRINGTCGIDATPCLSGNFEVDRLTMDLKFNLTADSAEVHSRAQSSDTSWTWTDGHPALIYKTLEDDGSLGGTVLQTVVTRANDCTRLKTCLAGSKAEGSGGVFGPDVLAPLGILLAMQSRYAWLCTRPQ